MSEQRTISWLRNGCQVVRQILPSNVSAEQAGTRRRLSPQNDLRSTLKTIKSVNINTYIFLGSALQYVKGHQTEIHLFSFQ